MPKYKFDYYQTLNALWKHDHSNNLYNIVETERKCPNCGGVLFNIWSLIKPKKIVFHCKENDEHQFQEEFLIP